MPGDRQRQQQSSSTGCGAHRAEWGAGRARYTVLSLKPKYNLLTPLAWLSPTLAFPAAPLLLLPSLTSATISASCACLPPRLPAPACNLCLTGGKFNCARHEELLRLSSSNSCHLTCATPISYTISHKNVKFMQLPPQLNAVWRVLHTHSSTVWQQLKTASAAHPPRLCLCLCVAHLGNRLSFASPPPSPSAAAICLLPPTSQLVGAR